MPRAYEQPPGGRGAEGLEDYVVYTAEGAPVGRVTSLLRRHDDVYLVVDRGSPPLTHDRRAVPWEAVADLDHGSLAVQLRLSSSELDRSLELDPDLAVEPKVGNGEPPELRLTDLPPEAQPGRSAVGARGPDDRTGLYAAALGLGLFAVLGILGVVVLLSAGGGDLVVFFLVPVALGAAALALAYRLWRRPYEAPPARRRR